MKIYNSSTHKKEEFRPVEEGKVRMYVCGPTVYDNIHIGNARTFISFDVIRRWLIASGYEVTFAQNLTDVDDKIINRANEQGRTAEEVAEEFSKKFIDVMRRANVMDPDVRPRATKEIGPMIGMIKTLIEGGHAYAADNGDVYFSVRSDPSYGEVSGRKIDDLMVGARIEENEDKKIILRALSRLSPRDRKIIHLRYGLSGSDTPNTEKTQKEVADMLGISQSYISRLEKRIIGRLKDELVKLSY